MKLVLLANYLILCFIWLSTVFLTGLKTYRRIIWAFLVSYGVMLISYFLFDKQEVVYLLFEFLLAQTLLFILLLHAILDFYPTQELIRFDFFQKGNLYPGLIFSNFLYTLAVWVDKYLFWFHPDTGVRLGPALHVSPLYDVPMFIAYLSIIPATSVFLLQIEANFAMVYPRFMETIFKRKNLDEINAMRDQLVLSGRDCILSLFKTQAMVVIIILLSAMAIFRLLGVVPVYINLLFILVVAAGLNVILWGLLNILYYMTRYQQAVWVNVLLCVSNLLFTALSLYLGPQYFGYGFALSVLLAIGLALHFLNKNFQELEYSTFMLID